MANRKIYYSNKWIDGLRPGQLLKVWSWIDKLTEEERSELSEEEEQQQQFPVYLLYINHDLIKQHYIIEDGNQITVHEVVQEPSEANMIRVNFLLRDKHVSLNLVDNKDRPTSLGLENSTWFIDQELYINTLGPIDEVMTAIH